MRNSLTPSFLLGVDALGKNKSDKSATRGAQSGKLKRKKALPKEKFYKLLRLRKKIRAINPDFLKSKVCSLFYEELKHEETDGRLYKSVGCQERAICPICGASYWRQKGREARSLFEAQRDRAVLKGWPLDQWLLDFEFTIPVALSRLIDAMPLEGKRKYLNELSRACYRVLFELFYVNERLAEYRAEKKRSGEKEKKSEIEVFYREAGEKVGGVAVLHFWHSKAPLSPHYHWHIIVSPYSKDGSLVLNDPLLPKDQLADMREAWCKAVSGIFGIGFRQADIHYEFVQENKKTNYEQVRAKFYHRFNYCFRHWSQDLLKYRGKVSKRNLTPAVERAKQLGGISKIRWFGYLSSVKRKKAGFELVHMSELTVCPECHREFYTEDLYSTLRLFEKRIFCVCGHCFEEAELGRRSKWQRTGRTFILKHFRKDGVIFAEWDEVNKRIVKGTERLVSYDKVGLFPSKGKRKRFVCRDP